MTPLTRKLYEYIKSQDEPVSMEYLLNRLHKNYDTHTALKALQGLHRVRTIKKTTKGEEVYYTYEDTSRTLSKTSVSVKYKYTKEERVYADTIWDTCLFITDEERTCARNRWQGERCKKLLYTPADFELYMEGKHGHWTWKKMKEERALA